MKIQISPDRIVKGAMTVWDQHGPNVGVVMDPKSLSFKPGSLEDIFSFHVLDHLFIEEIDKALKNWYDTLAVGGRLFVVVDDFEYLARGFVGGDFTIELFNEMHNHPTQLTKEFLVARLKRAGFREEDQRIWFEDVGDLFPKKHYELVLEATKNER